MTSVRDNDQVTGPTFPGQFAGHQANPSLQHVHGRLTGILVFGQGGTCHQSDERLTKHPLMAANDGVGRVTSASGGGTAEQLATERLEGESLHVLDTSSLSGSHPRGSRAVVSRADAWSHCYRIPTGMTGGIVREMRDTGLMTESTPSPTAPRPAGQSDRGRIVVGVDASAGSQAALRWALHEAQLRDTSVHAVIAWSYQPGWSDSGLNSMFTFPPGYGPSESVLSPGLGPIMHEIPAPTDTDVAAEVNSVLDKAIATETEHDPDSPKEAVVITKEALRGPAAKVLLDAVTPSDLLVVGSRGHGGFVGALLGSVSHHVVASACCPVVVVPTPPPTS